MSNYALSRLEHLYLQVETTFGQVPNSGGTASVAGANACRHVKATMDNRAALIERPDKTGVRSAPVGVLGRKSGAWSVDMSIAPNGVAGTAPDCDPLYQSVFGQAGTAVSGTASITAASNATPIVVTATNTFANGDLVTITGVGGNTGANGVWVIGSVSGSGFTLLGSVGNGVYTSGGTASRVSYKYSLSDSIPSLSMWSFRTPSSLDQRVAFGSVCQEMTLQMGQDVASQSFSGESLWVLSSNQFSVADPTQKGGLSAFPSEPGSPVTNGGIIAGFTGRAVVNGNTIATIRTATTRITTGNQLIKDTFGSYYPTGVQGDLRQVGVTLSLYEDDSTGFQNMIQVAQDKTPIQVILQVGTVAGSILVVCLNNVQMQPPTREEQLRYIANFPEAMAHETSLTSKDEIVMWTV